MIKLWNQTMPHRCVEDAFEPYLTPYDCDAAKTAIVVCPGGAYCGRADYEGNDVGAWLNTIGITAFVLEYRVAPSKAPAQPSDAQRAMRLARKLCMERGIERLGIMGFSAGGHLAATLSVHYDEAFYPPQDELDNLSACPDFTVLCYSVIDMGEYRHDWSRRFLLGDVPDEAQIEFYSPLSWFAWVPPLSFSSFYEFAFLFPSRNCDNIGRVCDNILCIASKYQLSFSFSVGQFYIDFTSA